MLPRGAVYELKAAKQLRIAKQGDKRLPHRALHELGGQPPSITLIRRQAGRESMRDIVPIAEAGRALRGMLW